MTTRTLNFLTYCQVIVIAFLSLRFTLALPFQILENNIGMNISNKLLFVREWCYKLFPGWKKRLVYSNLFGYLIHMMFLNCLVSMWSASSARGVFGETSAALAIVCLKQSSHIQTLLTLDEPLSLLLVLLHPPHYSHILHFGNKSTIQISALSLWTTTY